MKRYYSLLCITVICTLLLCACAATDKQVDSGEKINTQQTDVSSSTASFTSEETNAGKESVGNASEETAVQKDSVAAEPEESVSKESASKESASKESVSKESVPKENIPEESVPLQTESTENVSAEDASYTLTLGTSTPIYSGPGYDYNYVQVVGQDTIYTIVEEKEDQKGNLWGKLKSGIGWVDLTYVNSAGTIKSPITGSFADDALLSSGNYQEHIVDDSEYMVKIAFQAMENLRDVAFTSLQSDGDSYEVTETLYTLDTLASETFFVAGVVYYGDMTTYGISFTDSTNTTRYYAVYISARNGALTLDEYKP